MLAAWHECAFVCVLRWSVSVYVLCMPSVEINYDGTSFAMFAMKGKSDPVVEKSSN